MDTTLVSYMYRIKNIYVLLKGNETTDVTQVPLFFLRVIGYVAVNMINAIQTKCIKGGSSCHFGACHICDEQGTCDRYHLYWS